LCPTGRQSTLAYFRLYDLNGEAGKLYKEQCLNREYSLVVYMPYYGIDGYLGEIDRHIFRIINEELSDRVSVATVTGKLEQQVAGVLKAVSFLRKAGEKIGPVKGNPYP